ncbi:MAG: ATP synthase F1 subunit delta [Clostridia bacterium]|nr:ATP synthase F1 subunit delta [Clostridia bacterium]
MRSEVQHEYGGALWMLAVEDGRTEQMLEDVRALRAVLADTPEYIRLIRCPDIPLDERIALLDTAFRGKVCDHVLHLMQLLAERGHFGYLPDCLDEFCRRYDEANNIENVTVISAVPLTREQKQALGEKLSQKMRKNVRLTATVDPSVMGGIRVETEGASLDGTVRKRMDSIRESLLHTVI